MESKKYVDSYVAFIDILGFKEFALNSDFDTLNKFYEGIISFSDSVLKSKFDSFDEDALNTVTVNIISDSIIFSVPKSTSRSLEIIVMLVDLFASIFLLENNLLCRGGIASGAFYSNDKLAFGPALVKAYTLESTLAVYPRIIFTRDTYNEYINSCNSEQKPTFKALYLLDEHEQLYLCDYMGFIVDIEKNTNGDKKIISTCWDRMKSFIENRITKETNMRVRDKYLWFRKYYNDTLEYHFSGEKYRNFNCDYIFGDESEYRELPPIKGE